MFYAIVKTFELSTFITFQIRNQADHSASILHQLGNYFRPHSLGFFKLRSDAVVRGESGTYHNHRCRGQHRLLTNHLYLLSL
nr:unnamed protein product [Haemonchus contortus]